MPRIEAFLAFPENSRASDFKVVASFYRDWLAGEGRNPSQWLPLARHRAHLLLATDDPIFIYDAATFLAHNNDDNPEVTHNRLMEIAAQIQEDGTEVIYDAVTRPKYLYKYQPIPSEIRDLRRFVSLRSR